MGKTNVDGRVLPGALLFINGPIQDNQRIGSLVACVARVFAAANTAYVFPHTLGRIPNGFWPYLYEGNAAFSIYAEAADIAAWTTQAITLRVGPNAGTVSWLLL